MRLEQPCYLHLQQEERDSRGAGSASGDARAVDRYLRVRAKHPLASRPELWPGIGGRGPVTPDGIYQIVAKVGKKARRGRVPAPVPASLQPYLAGSRRCRGRPDGAERLVVSADAGVVRRQCPGCPGPPQLRPDHERLTGAGWRPGALAAAGDSRPASRRARGHRCCAKLVIRMVRMTRGGRS